MEPYLVYSNNHIDPPASYFMVLGLCALCLSVIALTVQQILRARAAAKTAEGAHNPHNPLVQGSRFVAGQVEYAQGETVAVDVTVTQRGTEQATKNGHTHTWTEIGRVLRSRPFYLRHVSGARVRVEPSERIVLVDRLDQMSWRQPYERRVRATLSPGEFAIVEGQLQMGPDPEAAASVQGYREGGLGWVMGPRPDGGMEASAESLSRRHELRARGLTRALIAASITMALGVLPTLGFWLRVVSGEDRPVQVVSLDAWTTRDSKGRRTRHWGVRVSDTQLSQTTQRYEVDDSDYDAMQRLGIGQFGYRGYGGLGTAPHQVWMRVVPGSPDMSSLGTGVSVHVGAWIFFSITSIIGLALFAAAHGHRRWYEGKATKNGNGRLGIPTGAHFADEGHAAASGWPAQNAPQWPVPGNAQWPASSR